jgi:hypothetical protein
MRCADVRLVPFKSWGTDGGTILLKWGTTQKTRMEVTNGAD